MKAKLEKQKIFFEEVEIEFPFYEKIHEVGDDTEIPYTSYVRITETDYTKIIIKTLETNIINFKRKFDYLGYNSEYQIDFQEENKEAFEEALKKVKENISKL
ncbi:MAG: hypothetical protein GY849_02085 [Deltaproteobacteria bacterium]|nr:hypothetical protein [Deltaproteobacteria bacterium]